MGRLNQILRFNIRRLRLARGWSPEELAFRYGCDPTYIYIVESGARGVGKRAAAKFAAAFGVSEEELVRVPPGEDNDQLNQIWQKLDRIQKGRQAEMLLELLKLFSLVEEGRVPPECVDALKSQMEAILKMAS